MELVMQNPERIHIYLESGVMTGDDFSLVNRLVEDGEVCLSSAVPANRGNVLQRVFAAPESQDPSGIELEKLRRLQISSDRFSQIETARLITGDASRELEQRIADEQCDLAILVRPTSLQMPQLLRELKCPTLLLGEPGSEIRRVVVAVHVTGHTESESGAGLERQRRVIDHAYWLAARTGAKLHVLQAWSFMGEEVLKSHMRPEELVTAKEKLQAAIRREIDRLLSETRCRSTPVVQLVEGEPHDVIGRVSEERADQVTVVGTSARTGMQGLILRNMVDQLIGTEASFLVVPASDSQATPNAPR
jgi:nucleotide-binding universal stress UspA family protein